MSNYEYEIFKKLNSLGENIKQSTDMEKEILAHLMVVEALAMAKCGVKARQYNEMLEVNREQIESELKRIESIKEEKNDNFKPRRRKDS